MFKKPVTIICTIITVIIIAVIVLFIAPSSLRADSSVKNTRAVKLIEKITDGQVDVVKQFSATSTLDGFVVKPKAGGMSTIVYSEKSGQYLFIGSIVSKSGENLNAQFKKQYIDSGLASTAMASVDSVNYISEGKPSAPHKAYIFIEPNCIVCNLLYKQLKPYIEKGELQVRWIPVAFRKPDSLGKAAKFLSASNSRLAISWINENENKFDTKTESGGIKPLVKNKTNQKFFDKAAKNTQFFGEHGFTATPTTLYKNQQGEAAFVMGMMPGKKAMTEYLDSLGKSW